MADPQRAEDLAFGYCLRRLTAAARSEHDLRTRLRERGYEDTVIAAVLDRLRRAGYVDDAAYALTWVRTRSVTKSLAAPVLRQELRQRGIDAELIESALAALTAEDEDDRARALLQRRAPNEVPNDRGARDRVARRLAGMLARKGYPAARAWALVDDVLTERADAASWR